MKYHANAKLTVHQRLAMKEEFEEGMSLTQLAQRYHISTKTVQRWIHRDVPTDRSSAPKRRRSKRGGGLKAAVKRHKNAHPRHGTQQICLSRKTSICRNEYRDNPDSCLYARVIGAGEVRIATHRLGIMPVTRPTRGNKM